MEAVCFVRDCSVQDYAFSSLGISRLIAMIDPQLASINVAQKAGFLCLPG
jgi:RimJ/RimL family protein N-acetyltransferase